MINIPGLFLIFEWNQHTPVKIHDEIIASINEFAVTISLGWKKPILILQHEPSSYIYKDREITDYISNAHILI